MLLINNDNVILSTKKKASDLQDAKWNRSVYEYDENSSDLVLNPNVNAGYNLAKRVRNIVNPDSIMENPTPSQVCSVSYSFVIPLNPSSPKCKT